jgi:hypothetical protein
MMTTAVHEPSEHDTLTRATLTRWTRRLEKGSPCAMVSWPCSPIFERTWKLPAKFNIPRWPLGAIATSLIAVVPNAEAQRVRIVDAPSQRSASSFTRLTSLAELRDGSTIVIEAAERVAFRVTWPSGVATQVAGTGAGPREVGYAARVLPLGDGSAVIHDAEHQRWLVVGADGRPGGFHPLGDDGDVSRLSRSATGIPFGASAIVFEERDTNPGASIVEWRGISGGTHPRGRRGIPRRAAPAMATGGVVPATPMTSFPPFVVPTDIWAASSDGWLAIVNSEPYRVELSSPDGRRFEGASIRVPRLPVTGQTREERTRDLVRQMGRRAASEPSRYAWPDTLPAFHVDGFFPTLHFAPDGKLWVRRTVRAEDRPTFDVFSRDAQLVERVMLPLGTRLLALGEHALYLLVRDADDLEYIQRTPFRY